MQNPATKDTSIYIADLQSGINEKKIISGDLFLPKNSCLNYWVWLDTNNDASSVHHILIKMLNWCKCESVPSTFVQQATTMAGHVMRRDDARRGGLGAPFSPSPPESRSADRRRAVEGGTYLYYHAQLVVSLCFMPRPPTTKKYVEYNESSEQNY